MILSSSVDNQLHFKLHIESFTLFTVSHCIMIEIYLNVRYHTLHFFKYCDNEKLFYRE